MTFLVATTSLPAVYRPNGYARTTTAGTPHARANILWGSREYSYVLIYIFQDAVSSEYCLVWFEQPTLYKAEIRFVMSLTLHLSHPTPPTPSSTHAWVISLN